MIFCYFLLIPVITILDKTFSSLNNIGDVPVSTDSEYDLTHVEDDSWPR